MPKALNTDAPKTVSPPETAAEPVVSPLRPDAQPEPAPATEGPAEVVVGEAGPEVVEKPKTKRRTKAQIAAEEAAKTEPDLVEAAKAIFEGDIAKIDGVYVDKDGQPLHLIARLAKVMDSLPDVSPEGENTHFKYKYITDKQVLGLLRPRLAAQSIMVLPISVIEDEPMHQKTARGGDSLLTRMTVRFRLMDGIYPEAIEGEARGYGDDSSDKGANKAYTAALKNFFIKLFLIGGDRDIEDDEEADKRGAARESGAPTVDSVKIGDANIEGVRRGGRSDKATDAQVARVGQYVRDLQMEPEGLAGLIERVLSDKLELGDKPWDDVKAYLEAMTGQDIGKLIAALDGLLNPPAAPADGSGVPPDDYPG